MMISGLNMNDENLIILGSIGQGKTVAGKNLIIGLAANGHSIAILDPTCEYDPLCSSLNGLNADFSEISTEMFNENIVNIQLRNQMLNGEHEKTEFFNKLFENILPMVLEQKVNYLVVDEGHWLINEYTVDGFIQFLKDAKSLHTKVIVITTEVFVPGKKKEEFLEHFPNTLSFYRTGLGKELADLKVGEAILFNKSKNEIRKIMVSL